jgi:hypothetical protein
MKIILALAVACIPSVLGQLAAADEAEFLRLSTLRAASRDRPDSSSPKIRTARNGIEISTPPDGEVTLRVGTNASISLNAIPSEMRGYTDAAVDAISLGYQLGGAEGNAAAQRVRGDLLVAIGDVRAEVSGIEATVTTRVNATLTRFEQDAAALSARMETALNGSLVHITELRRQLNASLSCAMGGTYLNLTTGNCSRVQLLDGTERSCSEILNKDDGAASGHYSIQMKVNANTDETRIVYCDMVTDGGGWTFVGQWGSKVNYAMSRHRTQGYAVGDVSRGYNQLYGHNTIAHYSQYQMRSIWYGSNKLDDANSEYLVTTGTCAGGKGAVVTKIRIPRDGHRCTHSGKAEEFVNQVFDPYRGVWNPWYNTYFGAERGVSWVVDRVLMDRRLNRNPLPHPAPTWSNTRMTWGYTGACNNNPAGNTCHYIPTDATTSCGEWLFRENYDNSPARSCYWNINGGRETSYCHTNNVPSLLFIR